MSVPMLLVLLGCLSPAERACTSKGGGFPGQSGELTSITASCDQAGGGGYYQGAWIGVDAATCLAALYDLPENEKPWSPWLQYSTKLSAVVWKVYGTSHWDDYGGWGDRVQIDATSGELLQSGPWTEAWGNNDYY